MTFNKRRPQRVCPYWFLLDGELVQCLKDTAVGKTYCPECDEKTRLAHAQPRMHGLGNKSIL